MSHFTVFTTNFSQKKFLTQSLNDLNIKYLKKNKNIIIIQNTLNVPSFSFEKNLFKLNIDLEFWQQSVPFNIFIQNLQQKYNYYHILNQSQKINFLVTEKNESIYNKKLILQRYLINS